MRISDWSSDVCSSDLKQTGSSDLFGFSKALDRSCGNLDCALNGWRSVGIVHHRVDRAGKDRVDPDPVISQFHCCRFGQPAQRRSEEHTSELQSLMRISYAVFCLKKKNII